MAAIASGICVDADNNNIARAAPRSQTLEQVLVEVDWQETSHLYRDVRIFVSDPVGEGVWDFAKKQL